MSLDQLKTQLVQILWSTSKALKAPGKKATWGNFTPKPEGPIDPNRETRGPGDRIEKATTARSSPQSSKRSP